MAETTQTIELLRQFAQKVTVSSVYQRQKIVSDLIPCLSNADISEQVIKTILRLLLLTLGRYHDASSRRSVESVIVALAKAHAEHTVRHAMTSLSTVGEQQKRTSHSRCHAAEALVALGWVCTILRTVQSDTSVPKDQLKKLVEAKVLLVHGALGSGKKSINESCYRRLHRLWTQNPDMYDTYVEYITSSSDLQYYSCAISSCIMRFLRETKNEEKLNKFKVVFLEVYSKHVLGCRNKIPPHVFDCCKDLLRHVTHDDFKTVILPAADKAMLRNPEIILPCIPEMITGLNIDLSSYALDLGRHLATQCRAKEESMQQLSSDTFKNLAAQCSDATAIEKLAKHLLDVINGSEGKLTGTSQKLNLLSAIGNLSHNVVSGVDTVQQLANTIITLLIPALQSDTLETTLVHMLSVISLWLSKFSTAVPDPVSKCLAAGLSSKTSQSAVRAAYIQAMLAAYRGDTLSQGLQFVPQLVQTIEKVSGKVTQPTQIIEAAHAACLLARLLTLPPADLPSDMKLEPFWAVILDSSKQLFSNDKFLSQASNDVILTLVNLSETLFVDHSADHPLTEQQSAMYAKILVYSLSRPGDHEMRKLCGKKIKRVSSVCGVNTALLLFSEFKLLLNNEKLIGIVAKSSTSLGSVTDAAGDAGSSAVIKVVTPRILSDALSVITCLPSANQSEAELVAIETLIDSHHPTIYDYKPDAWIDVVALLKLDAGQLVENNVDKIMKKFISVQNLSQAHKSALSTVVRVRPGAVLPLIIKQVSDVFNDPALVGVTRYDYGIFTCAEGELYDRSVIEGIQVDDRQANVKRENKLYSYDDQMADQQIRKELEEKKKKKMGITEKEAPKLTKKQQEMMQAQLQKESNIRNNMQQLDTRLAHSVELILSCLHGSSDSLLTYIPALMDLLVCTVHCPLAASRVTQLLIALHECAFDPTNTHFRKIAQLWLANCMMRLLKPECNLDRNWSEEPLPNQSHRVVDYLHSATKSDAYKDQFTGQQKVDRHYFWASTFAYCFPLLNSLIRGDGREAVVIQCLQIISEHAYMRTDPQDLLGLTSAEFLPRRQMLEACLYVISTTSTGKLQQTAMSALLDTALCSVNHHKAIKTAQSSGLDTSRTVGVTQKEIDILLAALVSPAVSMREAALQALLVMKEVLSSVRTTRDDELRVRLGLWVAKYDVDEGNKKLAEQLWGDEEFPDEPEIYPLLVGNLVHDELSVLEAAAEGLAVAVEKHRKHVETVLSSLLQLYEEKLYLPPPKLDAFGRVCSEAPPDQYQARCGIAMAMNRLAPLFLPRQIELLFEFFVSKALMDRKEEVRSEMLKAAVSAVNEHGKDNVSLLLPVFEEFLQNAPSTAVYDSVRQSVIILMGTLAKHLDPSSPKIKPIVGRLVEALSTPSQQVQEAVANCLCPLVPSIKADSTEIVNDLLTLLLESENYGERRGAAYGLAGLVKGLGILALKQLNIMTQLTESIQDKRNPRHREGALFAFEMLCVMLGRLFEPYVVHLLPHLLLCFGDSNQYVREAADDTAKAVMSKLSAHGVKLILPSLLSGLEEDSWRTKTGSVELLGAMAFCAPKQLSACLPSIVPKLMEVMTDSHLKVHKAGAQALKQIGSVIRNPEIQVVVPILLEALQDPTRKTTVALQRLLDTKFVHFIDAPSLALIMPVVQRALDERSTDTRKMAAQIIGNMYSLTDQKDLSPYLPTMIPGLKQSLLDPAPEVRSVSARALGTLVKGMGEKGFDELVPWLMETLTSESNTVDRSGAAQGLSEVVGGLGLEKLKSLMPDIIQTANRTDITPSVRDGYIMMYIYLPTVFNDDFIPYVGPIIPSILKALADESEFVRDTALKAGQRIVNMYAETTVELLLPEVERGLFDENWRIRYSSVQLLGDLLYRISGVSGKMTTEGADEDDNFGTESCQQMILQQLGEERRDRVLAGLYMGRSDVALMVRQAALHVWKIIVAHTPKMLRSILPTLFSLLLGCLASQSYDKRQVAARTLGDIVRKLGEKVLPEIIPILERGLESEDSDQRQGVCIGLTEIMASTSREHVMVFADSLIPTVRKALCDPLPQVRAAASKTFDNLHSNIGVRALEDIIPSLLKQLEDESKSEYALDGLKQVMTVKSRVVLPYLVPQLTTPPVNTRALSFLSAVAGEALTKHLNKILPALTSSLASKMESDQLTQELGYCCTVVLSVNDDLGQRYLIDELFAATNHEDSAHRRAAVMLLGAYCEQTKSDISEYIPQLIKGTIHLATDSDRKVLESNAECLSSVCKKIDPADMIQYIVHVRQAVRFAVSDMKKPGAEIPGFCIPGKGVQALLPIFREGILNGQPDIKEAASLGLAEVIRCTSSEAFRPGVVYVTGPLIRILGDRFGHTVKVALLEVVYLLLTKCGAQMKPFLPQLQTTFIKALNDPNRATRLRSAEALGKLLTIHTRVDPVYTELINAVKNAEETQIRDTTLQAIRLSLTGGGPKPTEKIQSELIQLLQSLLSPSNSVSTDESSRVMSASCLGALCSCLETELLNTVLSTIAIDNSTDGASWMVHHGRAIALSVALKECSVKLIGSADSARIKRSVIFYTGADRVQVCSSAVRGVGYWLKHEASTGSQLDTECISLIAKLGMKHESNEVKQLCAQIISLVSRSAVTGSGSPCALDDQVLRAWIPVLVMGTKEKNAAVKTFSESGLVSLLRLRDGDDVLQASLKSLEPGMVDSLNEVVSKSLRKIISQPDQPDEDIDNTLLK